MPELHATLTDTVPRRRAPRSRASSAAVSQRAAAWAETRAPLRAGRRRTTACRSTRPSSAKRAALRAAVWKSNFRRPRHRRDVVLNTGTRRDASRAQAPQGARHLPQSGRDPRRRRALDLGRAPRLARPRSCATVLKSNFTTRPRLNHDLHAIDAFAQLRKQPTH